MTSLSSSCIKSRIREHARHIVIVFIGFVLIAGAIDGIRSENTGRKIFGHQFLAGNGRTGDIISARMYAAAGPREKKRTVREVSAYNSVSWQTDTTPCISADGTDICKRYKKGECIVATNAYPLNTRLRIESIGDCTVADRPHSRIRQRVDLFMDKDVTGAKNFGVKKLTIAELEDHDV